MSRPSLPRNVRPLGCKVNFEKNREIQVSAVRTNPSKQTANNHERNIIFD